MLHIIPMVLVSCLIPSLPAKETSYFPRPQNYRTLKFYYSQPSHIIQVHSPAFKLHPPRKLSIETIEINTRYETSTKFVRH